MTNISHHRPLSGVLVVAMEQAVAAPLCTARLRDAGARVIKLERIGGDFARGYDDAALGDSSYFSWLNAGKESVTIDYKKTDDATLLRNMLSKADVFVQNLAPGVLSKNGFGDERIRRDNPKLITCNISGYGNADAVKELKAYDLLVQAESGLLSVSGTQGSPGRIGVSLCDIGCGVTAHSGILEALIQRGISGHGTTVNVSLFDVAAEWMSVPLIHAETGAGAPTPAGLKHPSIAPYGAYKTNDSALTLLSIQNEVEWQRLCRDALELPELLEDSRYVNNVSRVTNRAALELAIQSCVQQMNATQFRARLAQANLAFGALNSVDELAKHKALKRRQVISSLGHPLSLPAHPFRPDYRHDPQPLPNVSAPTTPQVPEAGQQSESIRSEFMK